MPNIRIRPHGCTDAIYSATDGAPTTMASLSNLVPAPDSPDQWVPRPGAAVLTSTYTIPGGTVVNVVLTSGSSWTCPADWNNANNTFSLWGAGGSGGAGSSGYPGGAGGGAFASDTNITLTPGTPYSYQIGAAGGTTGSGGSSNIKHLDVFGRLSRRGGGDIFR